MSDNPEDDSSGQTGGQASGGQTAGGGQAAGGQPSAGQAAGGQYQGQQAHYNTGPGLGDIFSRPATMSEIKIGVTTYAGVGVGFILVGIGLSLVGGGGTTGGGFSGGMMMGGMLMMVALMTLLFSPIIAAFIGLRQGRILDEQPSKLVYANAAVTGTLGSLVVFFIGLLLAMLLAGGGGSVLGNLLLPGIVGSLGGGATAAIAAWAALNLVPRQRPPAAQGQQQY